MALPIIENPLYGLIQLETAAWSSPFTWVDRTADLASGFNYSEGGRIGPPGSSSVDVGTLNATFKDLATVPVVGDLVRLRKTGESVYIFTGYVQDVSQRIVFDNSISLSTPVTLTTINCADWVGYISQFQFEGLGGAIPATGVATSSSNYTWDHRVAAIHMAIDPTYATKIISYTPGYALTFGDTDLVGTLSNHLDLIANTDGGYWYGTHLLPTNKTTGRTGLTHIRFSPASSGKSFTDVAGTAGQLHYTEIDFQSSSANVANEIVANNRSRLEVEDVEVTLIGGFNEQNYMSINGVDTVGVAVEKTYAVNSPTSIATYGNRQATIETNTSYRQLSVLLANLVSNPSVEYSEDGYTRNNTNCVVRRRKPTQDANPFAAYNGLWAMRSRQSVASPTARILFSGGEADGIPVVAGTTYYFKAYGARGTVSQTNMRANLAIRWYDDAEALLSTTTTASTTLTTANTWYLVSGSGAAPANAVRATMEILFERSSGANIAVGDRLWADAFMFSKSNFGYFDGDTIGDNNYLYTWTGGVGLSPSYRMSNSIDSSIANFLARYATTSNRIVRIRWNAQEELAAVQSITVGSSITVTYEGTTTTHRIVGIDGNVDPERYMIDYYLEKV